MNIKINITKPYKSIGVCEFTLPMFCVITGKNGSGKSHLLEAMADSSYAAVTVLTDNDNTKICEQIKIIPFGELNPTITESCNPSEITMFIQDVCRCLDPSNMSSMSEPQKAQYRVFIDYVQKQKGAVDAKDLTEDDLRQYFYPKFMGTNDMFLGKIALIFKNYARIKDNNLTNRLKSEKGYPTVTSADLLSDEEFVKKYGMPPWNLINDILKRVNIPYLVNDPETQDRDSIFKLELCDRQNDNVRIQCANLSTGEKTLMSLAMAIYNSDTNWKKPDLLLIDEPDAGLHPSMAKDMVNILRDPIVEKLDIPVVITTHSATTVAAMESIEIYEKQRGINVPQKSTKKNALSLLTAGIPFLSVSVEKRRAVFVESQYDADIYSELYEIFKTNIPAEPHFFPFYRNLKECSNCDNVITSAKHFKDCGNLQVYGIVDWDNMEDRKTQDNLLVLGNGERYAIENYILDPLLVGLFLIVERELDFSTIGITSLTSYLEIQKIQQEEAQKVIDYVINVLGFGGETKINYNLINGWSMQTAKSVFFMQGHMLEKSIKDKFPCFKKYNADAQKSKNLKFQIVKAIIKPCSDLLSKRVFDTLLLIK